MNVSRRSSKRRTIIGMHYLFAITIANIGKGNFLHASDIE